MDFLKFLLLVEGAENQWKKFYLNSVCFYNVMKQAEPSASSSRCDECS